MKERLDDFLIKKYNEIETIIDTNEFINKIVEEKYKNKTNISLFIKFAASFSVILLISISVYYLNSNKLYQNKDDVFISVVDNNNLDKLPVAKTTVEISENDFKKSIYAARETPDCILIVKMDKILGYTCYSEKLQKYTGPITNIKATILKTLKSNDDVKEILKNTNIEFLKYGGITLISDYEKILPEVEKNKLGFNSMSEQYKKETYINVVYTIDNNLPEIIVDKTYLICLKKDNYYFDKLYTTRKYGIMEYDSDSNKVKNSVTNEWEKIDLDKLI